MISEVVYNKAYLKYKSPTGYIRTRLKNPSSDSVINYFEKIRKDDLSKLDKSKIPPYCSSIGFSKKHIYENPTYELGSKTTECVVLQSEDIVFPQNKLEDSKIFITTRVQNRVQEKGINNTYQYFVLNPEDYNIKINAHYYVPVLEISGGIEQLESVILGEHKEPLLSFEKSDKAHSIPLKLILNAAGIHSLDELSDTDNCKKDRCTYRDEGAIFNIDIDFDNEQEYSIYGLLFESQYSKVPTPSIKYKIRKIPKSEYKGIKVNKGSVSSYVPYTYMDDDDTNNNDIDIAKNHGLLFKFSYTGKIGYFSPYGLFVHLFTRLALLRSVTSLIRLLQSFLFHRNENNDNKDIHNKKNDKQRGNKNNKNNKNKNNKKNK